MHFTREWGTFNAAVALVNLHSENLCIIPILFKLYSNPRAIFDVIQFVYSTFIFSFSFYKNFLRCGLVYDPYKLDHFIESAFRVHQPPPLWCPPVGSMIPEVSLQAQTFNSNVQSHFRIRTALIKIR